MDNVGKHILVITIQTIKMHLKRDSGGTSHLNVLIWIDGHQGLGCTVVGGWGWDNYSAKKSGGEVGLPNPFWKFQCSNVGTVIDKS